MKKTVDDIEVAVAGVLVVPEQIDIEADSLIISLPEVVLGDSVQLRFTTRLVRNAAVMELDLGSSDSPGLWQDVEPAERRSNVVLLPDLATSNQLIGDLEVSSPVVTPNGDGINDKLELSFVVFKADNATPKVDIIDLAGRVVSRLQGEKEGPTQRFSWDGTNAGGETVEPGIYLFRIDVNAASGDATQLRTISVAY